MNFFGQQQWLIIALVFFGFLAYAAWVRRRDHRWIEKRYGKESWASASARMLRSFSSRLPGPV